MLLEKSTIKELNDAVNFVCAESSTLQSKSNEDISPNVKVQVSKERKQIEAINPFIICFYDSLYEILDASDVSRNAVKMLLLLLHDCAMGNLICVKQSSLMKRMNTKQPNISRYMKELRDAKIVLLLDEGLYFNPQIISKGSLLMLSKNNNLMSNAISNMQQNGREVNFGTDAQLANAGIEKRKTIS